MSSPIQVDLPHSLGKDEARRRIEGGMGRLQDFLPGAAAVESRWTGDRLDLKVATLGQEVSAKIDVLDTIVRVEMLLPPALAFFGKAIEAGLRRKGGDLLEDKSQRG